MGKDRNKSEQSPKIMLSYSHEDLRIAEEIIHSKELQNLDIWYDYKGLNGGQEWDIAITEVLQDCDTVIALLSSNYFRSSNCQDELSYARNKNKNIILVYIEANVKVPEWFELRFHRLHAIYRQNYPTKSTFYEQIRQSILLGYVKEEKKKPVQRVHFLMIFMLLGLLILVSLLFLLSRDSEKESKTTGTETVEEVVEATTQAEIVTEEKSEESMMKTGTYVTLKDKNISNIAIFDAPGDIKYSAEIPEGKCCQVLDSKEYDGNIWAYIDYFGLQGWVETDNLRFLSSENYYFKIDGNEEKDIIFVNSKTLKLKEQPDSDSRTIQDLRYGTELKAESMENGWVKVTNGNTESGYVNALYVSYYSSRYWMIDIADGVHDSIHMRSTPMEDGEKNIVTDIPEGTILEIKEFYCGWGKTTYNTEEGWIKLHYASSCAKDYAE